MENVETTEINVEVQCELTPGTGGERWDVKEVIDRNTDLEFGDIGIHDFDAYSEFPGQIMNAILTLLIDETDVIQKDTFYNVQVEIKSGEEQLGIATRHGFGYQLLEERIRRVTL